SIDNVAFSSDGTVLATASRDHTAKLWNVTDPEHPAVLATITGHTDILEWVTFSARRGLLATASWDGTVRLWDVTHPGGPTAVGAIDEAQKSYSFDSAAFSPDGQTLATSGRNIPTQLWDIADPTHPSEVTGAGSDGGDAVAVSFSPDGSRIAT